MKEIFFEWLKLFYRTSRSFIYFIESLVSPRLACKIQNLFLIFHGSKLRFYYEIDSNLYFAKEDGVKRYFGERHRGFDFYARSIFLRGETLSRSYCLQKIIFDESDIVIDCGANYADLFLSLADKISEKNYITFEPGPIEHKCIKKSLPNARNFNLGLSDSEGLMSFYLSSATGDSSLIEPASFTEKIDVRVTTLDIFDQENNIKKCKLLKLEAEGSEPEILNGARNFLPKCEYVAVDGGLERGINGEATFSEVNNFLIASGFEMIDLYGPSYRALFRNSKIYLGK